MSENDKFFSNVTDSTCYSDGDDKEPNVIFGQELFEKWANERMPWMRNFSINCEERVILPKSEPKICAVIGPKHQDARTIRKLLTTGTSLLLLQLRFGSEIENHRILLNCSQAQRFQSSVYDTRIKRTVMLEINPNTPRVGKIDRHDNHLVIGSSVTITNDREHSFAGTASKFYVNCLDYARNLETGHKIKIGDKIVLRVQLPAENKCSEIPCVVEKGGHIAEDNLVEFSLPMPDLTLEEVNDITFAIKYYKKNIVLPNVVENHILAIRQLLRNINYKDMKLLVRIHGNEPMPRERAEWIAYKCDGIILSFDSAHDNWIISDEFKYLIVLCFRLMKAIFFWPRLLRNMSQISMPEPEDFQYIYRYVDAFIIAKHRKTSLFPFWFKLIINRMFSWDAMLDIEPPQIRGINSFKKADEAVALAKHIRASTIVVMSITGVSAIYLSHYRPPCPIIAVVKDVNFFDKLMLYRGIHTLILEKDLPTDMSFEELEKFKLSKGLEFAHKSNLINRKFVAVLCYRSIRGLNYFDKIEVMEKEGKKLRKNRFL